MSWARVRLEAISLRITKGSTPTTLGSAFTSSGVNFIKAEALNGDPELDASGFAFVDEETHGNLLKRSVLAEDDVLITIAGAKIGACGRVKKKHLPANTNQAVGIIRIDRDKAYPPFVYYFFKQRETYQFIQGLNAQAAQPNINLATLGSIEIPLPTIEAQKRIADAISAYDDLIATNQRRIALLEDAARRLYREWFVQLRFPGHEAVLVVDGVPEGWQRTTFDAVCEAVGGGTPSTARPEYWGGDVTWVTPTDVTRNDCLVLLDSEKKITEAGLANSSAKLVPPETILMTSRASIGFFALMDKPTCTNQGFISVMPKQDNARMFLLFNLLGRVEEMIGLATGATFKELSKKAFRALPVLWPTDALLNSYEDKTYPLIQQVRLIKKQNQELTKARDLLLPKLMSGQLDVSAIALPSEVSL